MLRKSEATVLPWTWTKGRTRGRRKGQIILLEDRQRYTLEMSHLGKARPGTNTLLDVAGKDEGGGAILSVSCCRTWSSEDTAEGKTFCY